jgi:hypothetical protein
MTKWLIGLLATSAAFAAAGCATVDRPGTHEIAYYDGGLGPIDAGYWGDDGFFYYRDGHQFRPDHDHHFRHDGGQGWRPIYGVGPANFRPGRR